jgi:hypothetical protein
MRFDVFGPIRKYLFRVNADMLASDHSRLTEVPEEHV